MDDSGTSEGDSEVARFGEEDEESGGDVERGRLSLCMFRELEADEDEDEDGM